MATVKISELPSAQQVAWTDVGFKRTWAGGVQVTNGTTGDGQLYCQTIDGCSTGTTPTIRLAGAVAQIQIGSSGNINWYSGSTIGAGSQDTAFTRFSAGVIANTDAGSGIRGLHGGGAAVASATAMPLPTGRVFHVTGTTNITSITSTNFAAGCVITLIFDGVLTFTDGNNLKLAGNFVTTADDTITLAYDGTNWYETSRSVN